MKVALLPLLHSEASVRQTPQPAILNVRHEVLLRSFHRQAKRLALTSIFLTRYLGHGLLWKQLPEGVHGMVRASWEDCTFGNHNFTAAAEASIHSEFLVHLAIMRHGL